jgi:polyhydroxyalkanoate synthesis regulator phasin
MKELTQKEYSEGIESMASEVIEECLEYGSDLSDMIHEKVDGDEWIIYTYYHGYVIKFSDNEDAYLDIYSSEDLGELIRTQDLDAVIQARAFFAMDADLRQAVYDNKEELEERLEKLQDDLATTEQAIIGKEEHFEQLEIELEEMIEDKAPQNIQNKMMDLMSSITCDIKVYTSEISELEEKIEKLEALLEDM